MPEPLVLLDDGERVAFAYEDLLRYHGSRSPAGVAHAFKVLERALPFLGAGGLPERRAIEITTAFGGPGARDAFELVTRAVTEGRYVIDESLERPELGEAAARFVFVLRCGEREATLLVRPGFVDEEMIALARKEKLSGDEERQLAELKRETAAGVMSSAADEVYDLVG